MTSHEPESPVPSPVSMHRRLLLRNALLGGGYLSLGGLTARSLFAQGDETTQLPAATGMHHPATAKRVVVIYALGGLSQFELFDEKPLLQERHGEDLPASLLATGQITTVTSRQGALPVVGAVAEFESCGHSGQRMSNHVKELKRHADKLAIIRTMTTDSVVHERANVSFFTGTQVLGRPSMGSWVTYGLGSDTKDLPEFVVMLSGRQDASAVNSRMWGPGFLPGKHQGVQFRSKGDPVLYVNPPKGALESRDGMLEGLEKLNQIEAERTGDPSVHTRISAYEKAARMQLSVPDLMDLKNEKDELLEAYGADRKDGSFARNCVLARRLLERGVRFVQMIDAGWDHHENMPKAIETKTKQTDKPIAAFLDDLHERGLLEETVVVFAGEFGRTPYCEGRFSKNSYGRDHNNRLGSMWMAGGGVQGGVTHGVTDEWGWATVQDEVHVNDVQATLLHTLGIDHERLTHRSQGRDFRLTDVAGRVVQQVLGRAEVQPKNAWGLPVGSPKTGSTQNDNAG